MGIIDKITETIKNETADDVAEKIIDKTEKLCKKAVEKIKDNHEDRFKKSKEKMISKDPNHRHLYLKHKEDDNGLITFAMGTRIIFYDMKDNPMYSAWGKSSFGLFKVSLYDKNKKKIGQITEKRRKLLNRIIDIDGENYAADYTLEIRGWEKGVISTKGTKLFEKTRNRMRINFNGWVIERDIKGVTRIKTSRNEDIAVISPQRIGLTRYYFLDFPISSDQELIVLLALMMFINDANYSGTTL